MIENVVKLSTPYTTVAIKTPMIANRIVSRNLLGSLSVVGVGLTALVSSPSSGETFSIELSTAGPGD